MAALILEEPAPVGAAPAPLRFPNGEDLTGRSWWAFGFPNRDPMGDSAEGRVGAALSYGWVRLDTESRYLIRPGFSGGGLWSPDYQAVVGIVGQAHANGDGRAITLHQADLDLPEVKLAGLARWSAETAGEVALAQWGWALDRDPEGARHWRPRSRGVNIDSERGWRFRGRVAALTQITAWLDRSPLDRRVLVVTGSPGVGKSAVLGRVVTTADVAIRSSLLAALPPAEVGVLASPGSVSSAVHAKGRTALEVAEEIARAASAALPGEPSDLAPAIRAALAGRPSSRFNVIIDALDEATSPTQARLVIDSVVLPMVETCSDIGVQMVVGTRRRDDGGDLLSRFGPALDLLDLDEQKYFSEKDLAAYALACLQLAGDERPGNPYADDTVAVALAARIAAISDRNFLIAGLIARSHGLHDQKPADPACLGTEATVRTALATYLDRLPDVAGVPAASLLTVLAFADATGLPGGLWQLAVQTLYQAHVSTQHLARFVRSSAANFLVETTGISRPGLPDHGVTPVYRLFHQALNDTLLHERADITPRRADEYSLTQAFIAYGRAANWHDVPRYLLRFLPAHAYAAGLVDELLTDDAYLLQADLRRLVRVADGATSPSACRRVRLLRLTPEAITAAPADRAALFSVTEALDDLGTTYRDGRWQARYKAQWAAAKPRYERISFTGHDSDVKAVCTVTVDGRDLLASGGDDSMVRLWDPRTGEQVAALAGHQGWVYTVCAVTVDGRHLLASGGDATVRLWDPLSGEQVAEMFGHHGGVYAVCAVTVGGRDLLASGSSGGTVRLWDPRTGEQVAVLAGHQREVNAVCAVTVGGQDLLASGGDDSMVRLWDPRTGEQVAVLAGHQREVNAVCAVTAGSQDLLASGGHDRMVRLWDPRTGEQIAMMRGSRGAVRAMCAVTVDAQLLLASGGDDNTVRLWDLGGSRQLATLEGSRGGIRATCAVTVDAQLLLASGGDDNTVRLWDLGGSRQLATLEGSRAAVRAMCAVTVNGRDLLASGDSMVRLWDPQTGEQLAALAGHQGAVYAMCAVMVGGRDLLASGGRGGTVRLWDPQTGEQLAALAGHQGWVYAVCAVTVDGRDLIASGGDDSMVRLWDPRTGEQVAALAGHQGWVYAVCAVTVGGRDLIASGGEDCTVRLWDPRSGKQIAELKRHADAVRAVCAVTVDGRDLLASGDRGGTVRLWDPRTSQQRAELKGHEGCVYAVCAVKVDGGNLLASSSDDCTVRTWDPRNGNYLATVPTHHEAFGMATVAGGLAIGLSAGILVVKPNAAA